MSWLTNIVNWFADLFGKRIDSATVTKVQAATVTACGFLPMAESVVELALAGNPALVGLAGVTALANQICAVVTHAQPPGLIGDGNTWTVNGVEIHGEFVNGR